MLTLSETTLGPLLAVALNSVGWKVSELPDTSGVPNSPVKSLSKVNETVPDSGSYSVTRLAWVFPVKERASAIANSLNNLNIILSLLKNWVDDVLNVAGSVPGLYVDFLGFHALKPDRSGNARIYTLLAVAAHQNQKNQTFNELGLGFKQRFCGKLSFEYFHSGCLINCG